MASNFLALAVHPNVPFKTARERVAFHLKNPVCAGCHKITDPMGLALENFDGAGQFRETERGAEIDTSGSLDGAEFKDVVGLGKVLHDHPALPQCLVKRVYTYGTGGPTSADDKPLLDLFNERFAGQGYKLTSLLRTIALSPAFSEVREAKPAEPQKTASAGATASAHN